MKKEINGKTYELVMKEHSEDIACRQCAFRGTGLADDGCAIPLDDDCIRYTAVGKYWKEVKDD